MNLKEKLETLSKEWTALVTKIKAKLSENKVSLKQKDNTIAQEKQTKQETITKLETSLKENSENEKVLEKLLAEFQELSNQI